MDIVFDTGQPMGVHAPTRTLTCQNPYPPTKGMGCSHRSKGLNLQQVNPRYELDKTYYYSYIVTMTQLCNGSSGWTNTTGGMMSLCASWLDKSTSSSSSVPVAALAAQECCHCRCRLSVHQLAGLVIIITVCPCTSWVPKSLLSLLSVPCGSTSCPGMSSSLLSVRAPAGWSSCCPCLSHGSLSPLSSPSVLAATQVVVIVVSPVAHCHRLFHRRSIAITVYPCASYPSCCCCHHHLSHGSSLPSARGSAHHRSLPLWLVVIIVVAMVGGDSWD